MLTSLGTDPETEWTHKHNLPRWKKKRIVGTRVSFLCHQSKHTKENSVPSSPHEHKTSKCQCWGRPSLYWDWCETTFTLWYTIRWWGAVGSTPTAPRWEVHLCGRCCGIWTLHLWRRWIPYRGLCQQRPIMDEMQKHTHTLPVFVRTLPQYIFKLLTLTSAFTTRMTQTPGQSTPLPV